MRVQPRPSESTPTAGFRPAPGGPAAGVYVHVPFCSAICPYCDFAVTRGDAAARGRYVDLLLQEISGWQLDGVEVDTLYLGGGTPSALAPEQLARLVEALRARFSCGPDLWITLEANPEDVDRERVEAWHRLGVRMLSLGVQALDDEALRFLGRRHRRQQALRAVETGLAAGFPVVSIDLIYAWPHQEAEAWRGHLREAVALGIQHLSCYELTVHDGTPLARLFARRPALLVGEERRGELFRATHRELADAGWDGYEVSNFARTPAARSKHNQKYWRHAPYLGLGPSAHSFDGRARWWNERELAMWARAIEERGSSVAGSEQLDAAKLRLEALMLGLRTTEGVDLERLRRDLAWDLLAIHGDLVATFEQSGLVMVRGHRLAPTVEGMAVADGLALRLSE
ncbi:MAG TPA: radical SAM family heme chaperone HemW [Thermoanaerobaculia bacterium]|nr:radical SAM family heme chaperone HemW [Thermoanaerobaculia bacterium]